MKKQPGYLYGYGDNSPKEHEVAPFIDTTIDDDGDGFEVNADEVQKNFPTVSIELP